MQLARMALEVPRLTMAATALFGPLPWAVRPIAILNRAEVRPMAAVRVTMLSKRAKNRKPLQRGRYLSSEAIQTIQALKRARSTAADSSAARVAESKVRRLLKADMLAVLRELQSQGLALLALQVFENARKEHWYKPELSIYAGVIAVLADAGFREEVERVCSYLKEERLTKASATARGFNLLFKTLLQSGFSTMAADFFRLMKLSDGEPDLETYRILVCGLEAAGEMDASAPIREEAERYLRGPLKCFLVEDEDNVYGATEE